MKRYIKSNKEFTELDVRNLARKFGVPQENVIDIVVNVENIDEYNEDFNMVANTIVSKDIVNPFLPPDKKGNLAKGKKGGISWNDEGRRNYYQFKRDVEKYLFETCYVRQSVASTMSEARYFYFYPANRSETYIDIYGEFLIVIRLSGHEQNSKAKKKSQKHMDEALDRNRRESTIDRVYLEIFMNKVKYDTYEQAFDEIVDFIESVKKDIEDNRIETEYEEEIEYDTEEEIEE